MHWCTPHDGSDTWGNICKQEPWEKKVSNIPKRLTRRSPQRKKMDGRTYACSHTSKPRIGVPTLSTRPLHRSVRDSSEVIFLNTGNNWREKATNLHCGIVLVGSGRDEQGTVLGNREPGPAALKRVKQHFTQKSTGGHQTRCQSGRKPQRWMPGDQVIRI